MGLMIEWVEGAAWIAKTNSRPLILLPASLIFFPSVPYTGDPDETVAIDRTEGTKFVIAFPKMADSLMAAGP
jgi:hypothetical protein